MSKYHFGLVMGIDQYPGLKNNLNAARLDALAFEQWLVSPTGGNVNPANRLIRVHQLPPDTPRGKAEPIVTQFMEDLRAWMEQGDAIADNEPAGWNDSRLYLYLSGHGMAANLADIALLMANAGRGYWTERVSPPRGTRPPARQRQPSGS